MPVTNTQPIMVINITNILKRVSFTCLKKNTKIAMKIGCIKNRILARDAEI